MHTSTRAFVFAVSVVAAAAVVGCGTPARHTILWPSASVSDDRHVSAGETRHEVVVARVDVPNRLYVGADGQAYEITSDTVVYENRLPVRWNTVPPGARVLILQDPSAPAPAALLR
ncbi:MAG: hypothetical protein HYR51_13530 [Candidatus Rokubacteria bacterium]|nr:hypothetical protein [Candidatus Rokubacteria bacterium]